MYKRCNYGRRQFIEALGKSGLVIPFLPSLAHGTSLTQEKQMKRFIVVFTGNGQLLEHWYPSQKISLKQIASGVKGISLSDIDGPISPVINTYFDKFRSKMNLIRGLDIVSPQSDAHEPSRTLSGDGFYGTNATTIDQIICKSSSFYHAKPYIDHLALLNYGEPKMPKYLSYSKDNDPVPQIIDERAAANRVLRSRFSDIQVKNFLTKEYSQFAKRAGLNSADIQTMQSHLELINQIAVPNASLNSEDSSSSSDLKRIEGFIDVLVAAVKSDLCRVFTLQMTNYFDGKTLPYITGSPRYHWISHKIREPAAIQQWLDIQQFHARLLAKLVDALDVVEDHSTGATYLDNSVVLWVGEQCVKVNDEEFTTPHTSDDMPMLMFGSAGGYFKTGQYLDYSRKGVKKRFIKYKTTEAADACEIGEICVRSNNFPDIGRPINEMLVTLMRSMGLEWSEWEKDGVQGFGNYDDDTFNQYDLSHRRRLVDEIIA